MIAKLRPPRDKEVIEIIATTYCDLLKCSNCHQMVAHQKERYHMTPENFRMAIRSLADWWGVIGMFGGNPCVHPQFDELCRIFREEIPDRRRRGILSNNINGHGKVIKETFGWFNLNPHADAEAAKEMMDAGLPVIKEAVTNKAWHSPVMVAIKDMIQDEGEMWRAIEKCDVNIRWSGAIRERHGVIKAYFCEVAAAFEGVYDEDSGIPVTPGWWKLNMDVFEHQVRRWCPNCGVALRMKGHQDLDFVEDISHAHAKGVREMKGRRVQLHQLVGERTHEFTDYENRRRCNEIAV
jgi:hypothetical protein